MRFRHAIFDPSPQQVTLAHLAVRLLKGAVHRRDSEVVWRALLKAEEQVKNLFGVLNLDLVLNAGEEYAYLRSKPETGDDLESKAATLMTRHQLSYPVSLLLGLLRKRLAEFESTGHGTRLVLKRDEIIDLLNLYLRDSGNEQKRRRQVRGYINNVVKLGYLRKMKSSSSRAQPAYEVERILKEFVNADWLAKLEAELAARAAAVQATGDDQEGT